MHLRLFKNISMKQKCFVFVVISVFFFVIMVFFFQSYAIYEENKHFSMISGSVPNQDYDVQVSYYIDDGEKRFVSTIPEGTHWSVLVDCDKGAIGSWNYDAWKLEVQIIQSRSKCNLTFTPYTSVLENYGVYEMIRTSGDGLYEVNHENVEVLAPLSDGEKQNLKRVEYRYVGENPNNYVTFNNELWRLIGLVNTPEGYRLKLIRNESIGEYSWDSSESSINAGWGINSWPHSDLQFLLNAGAYYNRTTGTCYNGSDNLSTDCDFRESGLTNEAKEMIDTVTWNLGAQGENEYSMFDTDDFYFYERGNFSKICSLSNHCNDTVSRSVLWKGQVGLMYPSDYGYATSGGTYASRESCLKRSFGTWREERDCFLNNWLYMPIYNWSMFGAPGKVSSNVTVALSVEGGFVGSPSSNHLAIRPAIYLKEGIIVQSGNGTKNYPYLLSI